VAARSHDRDRQPAMMAFYAAAWVGASVFTAIGTVFPGWIPAAPITAGAWVVSAAVALLTFGRADA
jgi:hypothetical protein